MNRQNAISHGIGLLLLLSGSAAAYGQDFLVGNLEATPATTAEERAALGDCQPGMTLPPGEDCTYPGTDKRFSVIAGGLARFLFGTFGESVDVSGRFDGTDYDLAASHQGNGEWRIDRVAGAVDSSPSFANACLPEEIWFREGVPIEPVTLAAATGGNEPLTYYTDLNRSHPFSFDPATRRITGTPLEINGAWSYYLVDYGVRDADGDSDEVQIRLYTMSDTLFPERASGTTVGYRCYRPRSLTSSFTDSTGRSIHYRLYFREGWDLSQPRDLEIHFHGNARGSEMNMLRTPRADYLSTDHGRLLAVVASPYAWHGTNSFFSRSLKNVGSRSWLADDARLIHELLQSDFGGNAAIDHDRIVFSGVSQGPCFVNYFLQRYAGVYGGGFYSACGCLFWGEAWPPRHANPWSPTIAWTPQVASAVASRFRVFVQATTEDFLHNSSTAMRDLYRDVLGFETRWDLDTPGGHCAAGSTKPDEILPWLHDKTPTPPILGTVSGDYDADGRMDTVDPDDDNDGALDIVDALPREPRDWLDTDADGIGNFEDRDADGDGVENAADPFPLDALEWADNDDDGIGDNIDIDDDNDGVPDTADSEPLSGPRNDQLTFDHVHGGGLAPRDGYPASPKLAEIHDGRPAGVIYPTARGDRQSWHFITLGDSANPVFEIMVDTHELGERCEDILLAEFCGPQRQVRDRYETYGEFHEERLHMIYVDRNQNQDLTDDGPPMVMADRERDNVMAEEGAGSVTFATTAPGTSLALNVLYATGEYLPYRMALTMIDDSDSDDLRLGYNVSSYWIGEVAVPDRESVLVGVFDANLDAVFNNGALKFDSVFRVERGLTEQGDQYSQTSLRGLRELEELRDYACVDLNRDGELNDCGDIGAFEEENEIAPMYSGEPFMLDGRSCTLDVTPTGHRVKLAC